MRYCSLCHLVKCYRVVFFKGVNAFSLNLPIISVFNQSFLLIFIDFLFILGYFLDQYTVSSGMTYSVKADATIPKVPSANLCGKLCSQYTKFQCKSFEYCTSTKNCLLFKIHELDLAATTASTSLTCSFYSSK